MVFNLSKKTLNLILILFVLISFPISAKETLALPLTIQNKISKIPATKSSWYIRKASGSKAGKVMYGPFENKEQAICVWIFFNLQENKGQCIAKNESFITKSPSVFYKKESEYLKSQIAEYGMDAVLDKYFFGTEFEIEEQPAVTQSFEEIPVEEVNEEVLSVVEAIQTTEVQVTEVQTDEEESILEPEETVEIKTEDTPTVTVFSEETEVETKSEVKSKSESESIIQNEPIDLPINNSIFEESSSLPVESVSRYKKEYLQDYAPIKTAPLPVEEEEVIEYKIDKPNQTDDKGRTLLMKACENGNDWEIENLLKSGADVNLKDNDGWTALMYGVRYQQNISIVKSLINAGADVKTKNEYGLSALLIAATYNDNPEILKLLTINYSVNEKELLQAFIMVLSSNTGSEYSILAKVKIFIDAGLPLNVFYQGKTPLMYAASFTKSTSVIKMLLQNGAQTQIRSVDGKTAFDYASENKALTHDEYYWALNQK